jgi:hypothetical protein
MEYYCFMQLYSQSIRRGTPDTFVSSISTPGSDAATDASLRGHIDQDRLILNEIELGPQGNASDCEALYVFSIGAARELGARCIRGTIVNPEAIEAARKAFGETAVVSEIAGPTDDSRTAVARIVFMLSRY